MTLLNDDNLGILPKVQRRNYSFSGWYTQRSSGQKVGESTVLNAGTTLYAHWSKVAKPATSKTGQITVSLKKVSGIKGYEIYYSTNKKFTSSLTAKVKSMSTKKTLKNLQKGATELANAVKGEMVYVSVQLENNPEPITLGMALHYDSSFLAYKSSTWNGAFSSSDMTMVSDTGSTVLAKF